ncbi:MAG: histidinol phosphate phosphatase domain-containing protein [Thermoplasmata archaeon]|nr:histidinol phosphate phosphatase domain-containing protein [Thermoplasmata archaeon]
MNDPVRRRFDFHSHTFLTDGNTSATDMWSAADRLDHRLLAITDHVALDDPRALLARLHEEARAFDGGSLVTLVGVELSMVPPRHIDAAARAARKAGAEIVIVHGETLAEPVPPGTNRAAIDCREVDLLAHPGLLDPNDAALAHDHGTFLELSGRSGHSITNGHVARVALEAKAAIVVDSDAHRTADLLSLERAERIARGAGLTEIPIGDALAASPRALARKLGKSV